LMCLLSVFITMLWNWYPLLSLR